MDRWNPPEGFFQAPAQAELPGNGFHCTPDGLSQPSTRLPSSGPDPSQRVEQELKDSTAARKVQKADREKLRRDRLNEQFLELGNLLDPDRPKNDKATILTDTIQMLKDLTAQVNRQKTEYASLSEESCELTQEKNELREEKTALKSEIDNLNAQYQQRLRVLYPWATMDPSVVMGPPPAYPFPMPVPIPSGPIPIHPSLQPYPFFRNQNPGTIPNSCSTYGSFALPCNLQVEHMATQHIPSHPHPSSNKSHSGNRQDFRSKSSDRQQRSCGERSDDFSDVATELVLKTPGSAVPSLHSKSANDQDLTSEVRKQKQWPLERKGSCGTNGGSSSRCSSSSVVPGCSSNGGGEGSVAEN